MVEYVSFYPHCVLPELPTRQRRITSNYTKSGTKSVALPQQFQAWCYSEVYSELGLN